MKCPECKSENIKVTGTRKTSNSSILFRWRKCCECSEKWGTYEIMADDLCLQQLSKFGNDFKVLQRG